MCGCGGSSLAFNSTRSIYGAVAVVVMSGSCAARRFAIIGVLVFLGIASPASATSYTPVLTVSGDTLTWTSTAIYGHYLLAETADGTTTYTTVEGEREDSGVSTSYSPTPRPGVAVTYAVTPRRCRCWSNAVTINWSLIEEGPTKEEPPAGEDPPAEEPPPTEANAGPQKYELDAASYFDSFSSETYAPWLLDHISLLRGYPPFSDKYVSLLEPLSLVKPVPVTGYHDASTEGYSPLTPSSIEAFGEKIKRDMRNGYAGMMLDDVNWSSGFRDGGQSSSIEPEQRELADLVEAARAAVGPSGIVTINSQYHDIWPLIRAGNANVLRALQDVSGVIKEFRCVSHCGDRR
jgi:hypothetical protein